MSNKLKACDWCNRLFDQIDYDKEKQTDFSVCCNKCRKLNLNLILSENTEVRNSLVFDNKNDIIDIKDWKIKDALYTAVQPEEKENENKIYSFDMLAMPITGYNRISMPNNETTNDPVNKPSHYTDGKIQVIEYIEDKNFNFHRGNAIKYISRAGKKDKSKEVEDLKKAIWYIERDIEILQKTTKSTTKEDIESFKNGLSENINVNIINSEIKSDIVLKDIVMNFLDKIDNSNSFDKTKYREPFKIILKGHENYSTELYYHSLDKDKEFNIIKCVTLDQLKDKDTIPIYNKIDTIDFEKTYKSNLNKFEN